MTDPVATLHDDGHYVWHGDKPQGFNYAGWSLKVYAVPKTTPTEAEATKAVEALRQIAAMESLWGDSSDDSTFVGAELRKAIRIAKIALSPGHDTTSREVIEPLTEPVSIQKALLGGKEAHVVKSVGKEVAAFLVNIQLTTWLNSTTAPTWVAGYVEGFNRAAQLMQSALVEKYQKNALRYSNCRDSAIRRGLYKTQEEYDTEVDASLERVKG
jgi:hypothetical protein